MFSPGPGIAARRQRMQPLGGLALRALPLPVAERLLISTAPLSSSSVFHLPVYSLRNRPSSRAMGTMCKERVPRRETAVPPPLQLPRRTLRRVPPPLQLPCRTLRCVPPPLQLPRKLLRADGKGDAPGRHRAKAGASPCFFARLPHFQRRANSVGLIGTTRNTAPAPQRSARTRRCQPPCPTRRIHRRTGRSAQFRCGRCRSW